MRTSPTTLICEDLALGWQSGFDISCDLNPISEWMEKERTWNAELVDLADPAFRLFQVTIGSGEGEIRPPALMAILRQPFFYIVPPAELPDGIPLGGTMRTLDRDPHPGSVVCVDPEFNAVPFTVDGRVITLSAPASTPVRIYYRPVLKVTLTEPWKLSESERLAESSWSFNAAEVGGDE